MYKLIKAENKDIEFLNKCKKQTILDYANNISNEEIERINNYVDKTIPKELKNYQVIICDSKLVGCILVKPYKDGIILDEIYLIEEYRNKGIGSAIISNLINEISKPIYLWVYKKNIDAIKLYKKYGFEIIEETEERYFMKK